MSKSAAFQHKVGIVGRIFRNASVLRSPAEPRAAGCRKESALDWRGLPQSPIRAISPSLSQMDEGQVRGLPLSKSLKTMGMS
jgi:hypothetical protein